MNAQAQELNDTIQKASPTTYSLLSAKGKEIFYPKKGILAQTADAKGKKIDATIGTAVEDDGTPMRLASIANELDLAPNKTFPYAPSFGRMDLRKKWQSLIFSKNPSLAGKPISLPIVTNALTHALTTAAFLFVDEGESIICTDLFWGNYKLMFSNGFGAKIDTFNTFKDGGFDTAALKEKLNEEGEKKVLLLNFPNNPTGYTTTLDETKEIVSIIKDAAETKKILVLCDDAYFGLVYEGGIDKESIFSSLCDLSPNVLAVKVDGATKEDYVWGFRVGFLTYGIKDATADLYNALELKTSGSVRGSISNVPNISQSLILKAYDSPTYESEKQEKFLILQKRYQKVKEVLDSHSEYTQYFSALPFNSGYFMCVKLAEGLDAEAIRQKLLADYDTGVVSTLGILRLAFSAVKEELIPELFDNLYHACKDCS